MAGLAAPPRTVRRGIDPPEPEGARAGSKHPASAAIPTGAAGESSRGAYASQFARGEVRPLEIDWSQIVRLCMDGDSGAWALLVREHHR